MHAIKISTALCLLGTLHVNAAKASAAQPRGAAMIALAQPAGTNRPSPHVMTPSPNRAGLTTLYTFTGGADGASPTSVVPGPHGSLVGTVIFGGTSGIGLAFQLTPPANGAGNWSFDVVHSFADGADGGAPDQLLADGSGHIFGEAIFGGSGDCQAGSYTGCGLVFELTPPAKGQSAWTETVLYDFAGGADGFYPQDGLLQDSKGDLFGTTLQSSACGYNGCGTVFELTPPAPGQTAWTKTTLWTFVRKVKGHEPFQTMTLDSSGRLFGILLDGGYAGNEACKAFSGCGAVFMLTPPASGGTAWTEETIWRFSGEDGIHPFTRLTFDAAGNVYGMANSGGNAADCPESYGCGTLYKLTPPAKGHGKWSLSLPWTFTGGVDGAYPFTAGLMPLHGFYLTTTSGDESSTFGSIDLFTPSHGTAGWTEKTLFTFTNDADGENPDSPLFERNGVFYGLTGGASNGGPAANGTIYSFKP